MGGDDVERKVALAATPTGGGIAIRIVLERVASATLLIGRAGGRAA
jgi:hypothetical protein